MAGQRLSGARGGGGLARSRPPTGLLADLEDNFASAARAAGEIEEVDLKIAGSDVRLRYAGGALRRLFAPALEHLRSAEPNSPDLVVRLWDSESTTTRMIPPPPEWDLEYTGIRGRTSGAPEGIDVVFVRWLATLSVVDSERGDAWFWTRAASSLHSLERAAPARNVLGLWMARRTAPLVHCAAVGDERGCVLVVGPSGAGKSSAALACLQAGLGYLGDDCCPVATGPPATAHALYRTAKVDALGLRRIPGLAPLVDRARPADDKAIVVVPVERVVPAAEIRAIAIPHITGNAQTCLRAATPREALAALAPSSLLNFAGADQEVFRKLAGMARTLPAVHLDAGTRPDSLGKAVGSLLAGDT